MTGEVSSRITDRQTDRQTDRRTHTTTTVTLAAHARRGLIISMCSTCSYLCVVVIHENLFAIVQYYPWGAKFREKKWSHEM